MAPSPVADQQPVARLAALAVQAVDALRSYESVKALYSRDAGQPRPCVAEASRLGKAVLCLADLAAAVPTRKPCGHDRRPISEQLFWTIWRLCDLCRTLLWLPGWDIFQGDVIEMGSGAVVVDRAGTVAWQPTHPLDEHPAPPKLLDAIENAAAGLLQNLAGYLAENGGQAPAGERWKPASAAVQEANAKGNSITLDWISKRKGKIRTREGQQLQLPGKHKLEVEMNSLAVVLFAEKSRSDTDTGAEEPERREREEIEARKRNAQQRKQHGLG